MSKRLAIQGHEQRGDDVINILNMLGGTNYTDAFGNDDGTYYFINDEGIIDYDCTLDEDSDYLVFSLEDFLEKFPFKVGDTIKFPNQMAEEIVKMEWDEDLEDIICTSVSGWTRHLRTHLENTKNNKTKIEKKLAIRGHSTRGKEVIELLEMLGGDNRWKASGNIEKVYYSISNGSIIYSSQLEKGTVIFTLDEFYKKYPFKVGDKVIYTKFGDNCDDYPVTIESMKWTGTTIEYTFNDCVTCLAKDLKMWNSSDNHLKSSKMKNVLAELLEHIKITPKEDLEREFEEIKEWSNIGPTAEEFMAFCECVNKKPTYPTTYVECCKVMGISHRAQLSYTNPDVERGNIYLTKEKYLLDVFMKLRICRNAYWKIAGEEMGLDKPWTPDWTNYDEYKHCLYITENVINKGTFYNDSQILSFPTAEMRDIFYENFKDLIEQCKELL